MREACWSRSPLRLRQSSGQRDAIHASRHRNKRHVLAESQDAMQSVSTEAHRANNGNPSLNLQFRIYSDVLSARVRRGGEARGLKAYPTVSEQA